MRIFFGSRSGGELSGRSKIGSANIQGGGVWLPLVDGSQTFYGAQRDAAQTERPVVLQGKVRVWVFS